MWFALRGRLAMVATVRCGALVGFVVFCVACDAQRPMAPTSLLPRASTPPTPPTPLPTPTPPAPPPSAPPLSGPSTTYHFSAPLEYPVSGFTTRSSYVLYNNGAFGLRYETPNAFTFTGSYRQEDGRIIFDFGADGQGCGGPPEAVAMPNGDLLEVRYCALMQLSDFEDAVYRRTE
jgi:hypothetical protein